MNLPGQWLLPLSCIGSHGSTFWDFPGRVQNIVENLFNQKTDKSLRTFKDCKRTLCSQEVYTPATKRTFHWQQYKLDWWLSSSSTRDLMNYAIRGRELKRPAFPRLLQWVPHANPNPQLNIIVWLTIAQELQTIECNTSQLPHAFWGLSSTLSIPGEQQIGAQHHLFQLSNSLCP